MEEKRIVIHQPYYLGYPGFFHKLGLGDVYVIMDDVQYDKRFTNRNRIISNNSWIWLTVPINKAHKFSKNLEVEINNQINWGETHWKKIFHSYKNSKFFNHYSDFLKNTYQKTWDKLFELDLYLTKQIMKWLDIKIEIVRESELDINTTSTQRLIDVCKKMDGTSYISGIGGRNYIDEKIFDRNKIKLIYQNYQYKKYEQHFSEEFIPDLSIIDMLFNVGPESKKLIQ